MSPLKTNMEPKNEGSEDESPFQRVILRFHVCFGGSILEGGGRVAKVPILAAEQVDNI